MNGRHERIYRGYRIVIDLLRRDDGRVEPMATTRELGTGEAGPSSQQLTTPNPDFFLNANKAIKSALDDWLDDRLQHRVSDRSASTLSACNVAEGGQMTDASEQTPGGRLRRENEPR